MKPFEDVERLVEAARTLPRSTAARGIVEATDKKVLRVFVILGEERRVSPDNADISAGDEIPARG
jgi:hypothetical protein